MSEQAGFPLRVDIHESEESGGLPLRVGFILVY